MCLPLSDFLVEELLEAYDTVNVGEKQERKECFKDLGRCPDQCGSVSWELSCNVKVCLFSPVRSHAWVVFQSPVWVSMRGN